MDRDEETRGTEKLLALDRCGPQTKDTHVGSTMDRGPRRQRIWRGRTPAAGQPRPRAAHSTHPSDCLGIVTAAHEKRVRKDLMTLFREYLIRQQHLLHHCGHLRTLRRVVAMVARPLDEVKNGNFSDSDLDDNLQKQTRAAVKHADQAEQQGREGKGAKTKDGEANRDKVASFI